jgi:hypothetical protein
MRERYDYLLLAVGSSGRRQPAQFLGMLMQGGETNQRRTVGSCMAATSRNETVCHGQVYTTLLNMV